MNQLKDLPNTEGFVFMAIYKDGSEKQQSVFKDERGLHRTENFNQLIGWK